MKGLASSQQNGRVVDNQKSDGKVGEAYTLTALFSFRLTGDYSPPVVNGVYYSKA